MFEVAEASEIFFQFKNVLVGVVEGCLSDVQLEAVARVVDEDTTVLTPVFSF